MTQKQLRCMSALINIIIISYLHCNIIAKDTQLVTTAAYRAKPHVVCSSNKNV